MRHPPSGTVTLVFTDIQNSTALWERFRAAFLTVVREHNRLMREALLPWNGYEVRAEGDAFFLVFDSAASAVCFAADVQRTFSAFRWDEALAGCPLIQVRIGMHAGVPLLDEAPGTVDYFGPAANVAAHVTAAASGGQVVVTEAVRILAEPDLPSGYYFVDLGIHRLKGAPDERLWQVNHPDLPPQFPPPRVASATRSNLPEPPTPLLGRAEAVHAIRLLLSEDSTRLVTLTGPAGVGKTRLAVQVAEEMLGAYRDGVCFLDLTRVPEADALGIALGRAFGLPEEGNVAPLNAVLRYLQNKQLLLLMDNFEHLEAAAPIVAQLLTHSREIRVLATSRSALRLRAEREYPVPPLEFPEGTPSLTLSETGSFSAIALFVSRARAVCPSFELTAENVNAVVGICSRLDGLPLAIELASPRVRALTPQALCNRLEHSLQLLNTGARDLPARHQTLRDTIRWSYNLLNPDEQRLFRWLAFSAGSFNLDLAEALGGVEIGTKLSEEPLDPLSVVESLVDKNLLVRRDGGGKEPRFGFLQTVRAFGREQLQKCEEVELAGRAFARHYGGLMEVLRQDRFATRLCHLDLEYDNLIRVLGFCAEHNEVEIAETLAAQLWRYWDLKGYFGEGRSWIRTVLALSTDSDDWEQGTLGRKVLKRRAELLAGAGALAHAQADYPEALRCFERSLELWRQVGDSSTLAAPLINLGVFHYFQNDLEEATVCLEEALHQAEAARDPSNIAAALNNLGLIAFTRGAYEQAESLHRRSLALRRELGHQQAITASLNNLGLVVLELKRPDEARKWLQESLTIATEIDCKQSLIHGLERLARLALRTGYAQEAVQLLSATARLRQEVGFVSSPGEASIIESMLAETRTALGERLFAHMWQVGQEAPVQDTIRAALQVPSTPARYDNDAPFGA